LYSLQYRELAVIIARSLYLRRRTNFKAQNRKTKTDTNPIPDPNRYRRHCPDPFASIQKFYTHSQEGAQSAIHSLPKLIEIILKHKIV